MKFLKDNLEYQQSVEVFKDVVSTISQPNGSIIKDKINNNYKPGRSSITIKVTEDIKMKTK